VQPCSIEVQKAAIQNYARAKGFVVVRTYQDLGRSGLSLRRRPGLSALLNEIASGRNDYQAILVYDVSRWGRFQDVDESAHYEFLCKKFKVPVHYCAESFANDGTWPNFILKSLKRAMAAEYSRDLSARIFRGQKHVAQLGFRTGASPGYGFQRVAISSDGLRTQSLRAGEYKSLSSDHIVLVPGPPDEVRWVREIFTIALRGDVGFSAIAAELNRQGVPYRRGHPWRSFTIKRILTSQKYAGWNVWNQVSTKLQSVPKRNPSDQWVRVPQAFSEIVNLSTFERVQEILPTSPRWTSEQIVRGVEQLAHKGRLSQRAVEECPEVPSPTTLRRRVCGLRRIYSRRGLNGEGFGNEPFNLRQRLLILRNNVFDELADLFPHKIATFHLPRRSRQILRLDNDLAVSVVVCGRHLRKTGVERWNICPIPAERHFMTLICLDGAEQPQYYLAPSLDVEQEHFFVGLNHRFLLGALRLTNLAEFYEAAGRFLNSNPLLGRKTVSIT
jgi:DNA invertase Pin-like site-specific DNA recombinase